MDSILYAWLKVILFFVPLFLSGVAITSFITRKTSWEKNASVGIFAGVSIYIFLVNTISYFIHPSTTVKLVFVLQSFIAIWYITKLKLRVNDYRPLITWCVLTIVGTYFLYWYIGKENFGGDIEIITVMQRLF
jgi:hypothetical protein